MSFFNAVDLFCSSTISCDPGSKTCVPKQYAANTLYRVESTGKFIHNYVKLLYIDTSLKILTFRPSAQAFLCNYSIVAKVKPPKLIKNTLKDKL